MLSMVYTTSVDAEITKQSLEKLLKQFEKSGIPLQYTSIVYKSGQWMIDQDSFPSINRQHFLYVLKEHQQKIYITELIAETETLGQLHNFTVRQMNQALTVEFTDLGYAIQDEIEHHQKHMATEQIVSQLDHGKIVTLPPIQMGQYAIKMRYKMMVQFENRTPEWLMFNQGQLRKIPKQDEVFIGYDYANLKQPHYLLVRHNANFRYYEQGQLFQFWQQLKTN